MPEYTSELYNWINSIDNTFSKDVSLDSFKSKMSDQAYAKKMYDWVSQNDKAFKNDVSFNAFYSKVNSGKKKVSASGGVQKQQPTSSAGTATQRSQSSVSSGKGDGIYKLGTNDNAIYKKEGGQWYVDWNYSGNFMPLKKGDVQARVKNLEANAQRDFTGREEQRFELKSAPSESKPKQQATLAQKEQQKIFSEDFWVMPKEGMSTEEQINWVSQQKAKKKLGEGADEKAVKSLTEEYKIFEIQKMLKRNGFDIEVNGNIKDPKTVKALAKYNLNKKVKEDAESKQAILDQSITNLINSKSMGLTEEAFVPLMNKNFQKYGFTFEESGMGDYVTVKYTSNGIDVNDEITIDLRTSDNKLRSQVLQSFMKKHYMNDYEKRVLNGETIGVSMEDDYDEYKKMYYSNLTKLMAQNPEKYGEHLLNENVFNEMMKSQYRDLKFWKSDVDQDVAAYERFTRSNAAKLAIGDSESVANAESMRSAIEKKQYELQKKFDRVSEIENNYQKAVGYYSKEREKQGNLLGGVTASLAKGITSIPKAVLNLSADVMPEFLPNYGLSPDEYESLKMEGKTDSEISDYVTAEIKRTVVKDINEGIVRVASAGTTTSEYLGSQDRSMLEKAIFGLSESVAAAYSGGGNKVLQTLAFFTMSSNSMQEQLSSPEFDSMSKWEKGAISSLYGLVIGQLEKIGFDASAGNITNPMLKKLANNVIMKSISEMPENATISTINQVIGTNLRNTMMASGFKVVNGAVSEGTTEGTQALFEIGMKNVVNAIHKEEMFKDVPDLSTADGIKEALSQSLEEAAIGAIGGSIMSSYDSYRQAGYNKSSDATFSKMYKSLVDPVTLKSVKMNELIKFKNGDQTREQAENNLREIDKSVSIIKQIPDVLSARGKKLAYELIEEREFLKKEIEGKEPNLVVSKTERINEINEQLKNISTDAVQEQTTTEGVLRQEGSELGLQEVEQGDKEVVAEQGQEEVTIDKPTIAKNAQVELDRVKQADTASEDGATLNLDGTKYEGGGLVVPVASMNTTAEEVTPEMIADFVEQNSGKIGDKNTVKVGVYKFPGSNKVSIDLNVVVPESSRQQAIEFGRQADQESLFDLNTLENVKTGGTGQNPMQFTDVQFKEIAKALNEGRVPNVFNQDNRSSINPEVRVAAESVERLGAEVVIFETQEEYQRALAEEEGVPLSFIQAEEKGSKRTSGSFTRTGKVFVDGSHPNKAEAIVTMFHEAGHFVFEKLGLTESNLQEFVKAIEKVAKDKDLLQLLRLHSTQDEYVKENQTNEEYMAELFGRLAADKDGALSTTNYHKVLNAINNLFKALGLGPVFKSTASRQEVVDFVNKMVKGLREGDASILNDPTINSMGITSKVVVSNNTSRKKSIVGDIFRFDTHPNTKVTDNVPLKNFSGKVTSLFESDRMTAGYIKDDVGAVMFKFFGGVNFPAVTGKWWASMNATKAKAIARSGNENRDADGYIYGAPMVGSNKQHMSNNDMLAATVELMKLDISSKGSKVTKDKAVSLISKAFNKKSLSAKKPILNNVLRKTNTVSKIFDELEFVLFQEGQYIVDREGNFVLDSEGNKIKKLTFENRKSIIETILGNASVKDVNFPSAGNSRQAAERFAEPLTSKTSRIGDLVVLFRTKGILKHRKSDKNDEFYHKSYPYEIYAENEDGSQAEIEMFVLDGAYSMRDVFPSLKKSSGGVFTWDEYDAKHGAKGEKTADAQYNRTAKLSSATGKIKVRNKRISEVGGRNVGSREIVRRTNVASEKLKTLFDRDNIPLSVEEAKEMVQEVIDWSNWYDGISEYSQDVFGEYAEDFLSLLPLSSQAANSPTTVALAIGNIERIYKGENPIGVAEYYGYVSDFLAGKGIKSDKMYNFFKALTGDKDAVAVDMHVWSLIMGKDPNKKQVNPKNQKEFDKAKEFVNLLSKELGLAPREIQASLWAANILRTGGKPDSYEEYIERQVREKGLEERIQGWRNNGYKPFSEIRKRREAENEAPVVRKKRMTEGVSGNKLFNNPLKEASKIAEDYARKNNIDYVEPEKVLSLDSDVSKQIADEYEKMKDNPRDPEVRKAYNAMIKETIDQYNEIVSNGYVVEVNNDEPYSSADDMINDLRENKRMKIFSTESGFGDDPITDEQRDANPLLADSGLKDVNGVPLLANDVFRFVHDFFGHAKWGNGFGPVGEENAWTIHSAMYSPLARRAMTSETRGQNSWVNFSGVNEEAFRLRDKARQLRREGKTEEASALVEEVYGMMKFADQKVGLMPEWTTEPQSNLSRKKRITPTRDEAIQNAMDKYKMSMVRAGDKVAARRSALADLQKGAWWDSASDVDRDAALRELRKKLGLKEVPAAKEKRKGNDVTVDEYDALVSVIKREAKAARDKKKQVKEVMQTITEYVREQLKNKKILPRQASAIVGKVNVTNFDSQKSIDKLFEYVDKAAKDATYMEKLTKASQLRKALSRRAKNGRNPLAKFAKAYATLNPKYVEDIDQYIEIARLLNASFERSAVDSKSSEVKWKSEVSLEQIADYLEQELKNHAEIELQKLRNRYEKLTGNSAANMSAEQIQEALRTKPADVADVTAEIKERLEELKQSVDDDAPQSVKDAVNIDPTIVDNRLALDIIDAIDSYLVNGLPGGIDKIMARYDALKSISETNMKAKKIRVFGSRKVGRVTTEYATNINMMIERMFSGAERAAKFMKLSGWNGIVNGFAKATRQAAEKSKAYTTRYKGIKNFNSVENIFERGAIAFLSRTSQAADEFNIRRKLLIESEEALLEGNDKDIERAKAYRSVFEKLGLYNDDATLDSVMSKAEEFNKDAVKWVTRMWGDVYGDFRDFSLSMRNTMLANDINYTTDKHDKIKGNESKTNPDEDLVSAHAYSKYANVSLNKNEAGVLIERTHSGKLTDGRYVSLDFDTNNMRGYKLALVDMYTAKSIYQLQEFMNSKQFREVVADADDRDLMAKAMKQYVNAIKGKSAIDVTSLNEFQKLLNILASFGAARALAGVSQAVSQYSTATINTIVNAGILNVDFRAPFNTKVNEFINRSGTATANRGYDSMSGLARADEMAAKISSGAISGSANAVLDTVGKINETMLNLTLVKPDVVAARTAWWAYYTKYCKKNKIKIDLDGDVNKEAAEYAQQMVDRNMDVSDAELKGILFKQTSGFGGILKNLFFPFASFSMNMKQRLYNDFAVIGTAAVKKLTGATDNMPSNEDLAVASRSLGSIFAEMAVYNGLRYYVASAILEAAMSLLDLDDEEKEAMRDEIKAQAKENVIQKAIEDLISPSPITNGIVLKGINYLLDGMDYGVSQKDIDDAVKEVNEKRLNKGDEEMSEAEEELFVENFIAKNQYQFYISDDRTAGMYGIQYERIAETLSMIRAAKTGEYYELGRDGEWHKRILTEDARKKMFLPALLKSTSQLTVREFDQVSNRMFKILKKQSSITPKQKIKYDELKKAGMKIDRAIMQKIKDGASVETIMDFDSYYANLTEAERLKAIEEEKGQ